MGCTPPPPGPRPSRIISVGAAPRSLSRRGLLVPIFICKAQSSVCFKLSPNAVMAMIMEGA